MCARVTYGYLGFKRRTLGFFFAPIQLGNIRKISIHPAAEHLGAWGTCIGAWAARNVVPGAEVHSTCAWALEAAPQV